jgi:hypothetical protein
MTPLIFPLRVLARGLVLGLLAAPLVRGEGANSAETAAAVLAVTPRSSPPPAPVDPDRPPQTRLLKGSVWTDDVGRDDNGNLYNQYKRSSFGTWSNYDEAKANPFPLPPALVLANGQPVNSAAQWWRQRRPEILEAFRSEVYGRIPPGTPSITWKVTATSENGGTRTKRIVGQIDNSAYPAATPVLRLTLTLPAHASGPVPVIVVVAPGEGPPRPGPGPSASPLEQVIARGWGLARFDTESLQPDSGSGLTRGIIGLMNRGQPRTRPDDWGVVAAWVWGLSRTIDYLETDPDVDARRLGVEGHSRWGKTALWAAASEPRWAIVYASCSGEGGAKLFRRNYGETTDNIAGSYWMAGAFRKYGGHWNDLPVDAHELIALVAPRPAFITGATQDPWSDPHGEFLAAVAAGPVYRLLGRRDLGTSVMPAPDVALVSGEIAFREHVGAHTDGPDWPVFLAYASRYLAAPGSALR